MSLQTGSVSMIALGVDTHATLQPGIHLCWTVQSQLGFPPLGFDLFRRNHRLGTAQTLSFGGQPLGSIQMPLQLATTQWTTGISPAEFWEETISSQIVTVLMPQTWVICRFLPPQRLVRRIEIDLVHWRLPQQPTGHVSAWGIIGGERVTQEREITLTSQNRETFLSMAITGDALDGFQIVGSSGYGIAGVHWVLVEDEAEDSWGVPLNQRRIGFPVTVPGYLVTHAHSPDDGSGQQDWQEAADRLSPTGSGAQLPSSLAQLFGPPVFAETRNLMREALARRTLTLPQAGQHPEVTLGPINLLLLLSVDPDLARLLGLARVDRTAVVGSRYDYKVVGYWPGQLRFEWVCADVPNGGTAIPSGGSIPLTIGGGEIMIVKATTTPSSSKQVLDLAHRARVLGAAWAPYGQRLLSWADDGRLYLWETDGGTQLLNLPHERGVLGAAWAPDGKFILSWAGNMRLHVLEANDGTELLNLPHERGVLGAAWAPDGQRFLSWAGDGNLRVWETERGTQLLNLPHERGVLGAAWAPDGQRFLSWAGDNNVRVWDRRNGDVLFGLSVHDTVGGVAWSSDERHIFAWTDGATLPIWPVTPATRSLHFELSQPTDGVQIVAQSDEPRMLTVVTYVDGKEGQTQTAPPGTSTQITVTAPGTTSVTVSGNNTTVRRVCRLQAVQTPVTETWICFDVARGSVPVLDPPDPMSGRVMPGFAEPGRAEQVIGLTFENHQAASQGLLPLARLPLDAVLYEVMRRADGELPISGATGTWLNVPVDEDGKVYPLMRSTSRPPAHKVLSGWSLDRQDFIDDTLDANVRYYSYRVRARDLFGRGSDWSSVLTVDAADTIAPPAPSYVTAYRIDVYDPWLSDDDYAALAVAQASNAVRVRWGWPYTRQEQAPDAEQFRVYWNSVPFSTRTALITSVQRSNDICVLTMSLDPPGTSPPAEALAGDWLRQGDRQYRILSNSASDPTTVAVSATGNEPPLTGICAISLRPPDAQRLDLLGSPLRVDASSAINWQRRLLQGPLVTVTATIQSQTSGVAVTIQQVQATRPTMTALTLTRDWRWSGILPDGWVLSTAGVDYPILGGTLGIVAILFIDTSQQSAPQLGPGLLRDNASQVRTIKLDTTAPGTAPFTLVGGSARAGQDSRMVLGHRTTPAFQIVLDAPVTGNQLGWFPDYEALLTYLSMPVGATAPHATAMVGVSAVDNRTYIADKRLSLGVVEPTGPGNEGPVASVAVQHHYRGKPNVQPAPEGSTGVNELWAPVPDEFTGTSRYPLRWPAAGATRFFVYHATLDAVLDADQADRAACRGMYSGQPALSQSALVQWRVQQASLNPQSLQAIAAVQKGAFAPLTTAPLNAADPLLSDPQTRWLRWLAPLDGHAPGRHFLRVVAVDEAGNAGDFGPSTLPIVVPDVRRPLPPRSRPSIKGDRCIWLTWDATDLKVNEYQIYRTQLSAGSQPDIRDMTHIASLGADRCPEPAAVFKGSVQLAGSAPDALVAVYRAEDYDVKLDPDAQTAASLTGTLTLDQRILSGLDDLPDGTLVFVVVRYTPVGSPALAVPSTGRAYRDTSVDVDKPYQYRIEATRQAAVGPGPKITVRSFPSNVEEGTAFDASRPVPPTASATWLGAQQVVRVSWQVTSLRPDLQISLQRSVDGEDYWVRASVWVPASAGSLDDASVKSGEDYVYKLRARYEGGLTSENEPVVGPITIP